VFVGQSTTIRLAGWYPNRTFAITLDGSTIGTVTTGATGAATLPYAVTSALSLGTHTVKATSATDGATATATLTVKVVVLGTVTLSPPKVKSGKQVKVELFGWSPNATLSVLLDGSGSLGTVTTDATGYGQVKVTIPAGTSVGDHQVVVRAADGGQVTSALQVSR